MEHKYDERLLPTGAIWLLGALLGIPLALLIAGSFGVATSLWFALFLLIACLLLPPPLRALRRRIGPEPNTIANLLTLGRLVVGCALAAFVLAGAQDRMRFAAGVIWVLVVLAVTASDWLDGPIARHEGPTRFGAVLDIESDSWLTFWCAAAAVSLGDLPWVCLLAPVVRYIHPLLDLRAGGLPSGGGPWWSRVTGVAQMALLLAGFAPVAGHARDAILGAAVWPVSLAQLATMLALLAIRRR